MPKFAANLTMMFKETDFLNRFERARQAGFKAVEFLWPYDFSKEELQKVLKDTGLKIALFNTVAGDVSAGEWGHAGLPGREADAHAEIEQALDYANALDCRTVHMMSCVVPYPWEKEICRRVFIKNVQFAADLFAKYGRRITIEALCPDIKPRYLYHSQYETLAIREEVARDNVFIQFDTFHAQMVDGNLSYLMKKYLPAIGHVQIAAAPSRHEPDEGELNYDYIFELFDKLGYTGYIGCEYNPRGKTEDGLSWFDRYKSQQ